MRDSERKGEILRIYRSAARVFETDSERSGGCPAREIVWTEAAKQEKNMNTLAKRWFCASMKDKSTWQVRVQRAGRLVVAHNGSHESCAKWAREYGKGESVCLLNRKDRAR